MRVIAGTAKGTKLGTVPPGVRPVSDRAREGLFSSLESAAGVEGARVLDLYAGTGALGIEALSRGAATATFVDASASSLAAVRANAERARVDDRIRVVRADATRFLTASRGGGGGEDAVDLCLLDPPYDAPAAEVEEVLSALGRDWLRPGWTVALTRPKRSSTLVIPVHWAIARRLTYGDSLVICYREE
jgi:16S rRNA (guanine966-N2)-methyltransferase